MFLFSKLVSFFASLIMDIIVRGIQASLGYRDQIITDRQSIFLTIRYDRELCRAGKYGKFEWISYENRLKIGEL